MLAVAVFPKKIGKKPRVRPRHLMSSPRLSITLARQSENVCGVRGLEGRPCHSSELA